MIRHCTLFLLVLSAASRTCADTPDSDLFEATMSAIGTCQETPITLCVKERALRTMDTLPNEFDLGGGFTLRPQRGAQRSGRFLGMSPLPQDVSAREDMVDDLLIERIEDFLSSHTLQFHVPENAIRELRRSLDLEEGRKKKKKTLPLFLLLKMKAAAIGAIMLKMIGFVALKALIIAKISLVFASITVLKKLVEPRHDSSSYEVVAAHPYGEQGHSLDRSLGNVEMAYGAYDQKSVQ